MSLASLPPGTALGVLGGGQLGRMFVQAASRMGYLTVVFDPDDQSPAGQVATHHLAENYLDPAAIERFIGLVDAATVEFENIPRQTLHEIEARIPLWPSAQTIATVANRIREKEFLSSHGLPCVGFQALRSAADFEQISPTGCRWLLKTASLGYDGKGQFMASSLDELGQGWRELGSPECIIEDFVELEAELSVIAVRSQDGATACFAAAANVHRHGILDYSLAPAPLPQPLLDRARELAEAVLTALDYRGVLGLELFVVGGELLINEIAPRPHNSGHHTLDAAVSSQFEQQVRVVAGQPLADCRLLSPALMVNLIGLDLQAPGIDWRPFMAEGRARLHLYGKREARPGRKMGHFNLLCENPRAELAAALDLRRALFPEG